MTYVMSDIHGQKKLYDAMLEQIKFSSQDKLYIIGDVLDRGPAGVEILSDIIKRKNITLIRGNHEQMFLEAYGDIFAKMPAIERWINNGARPTIQELNKLSPPKQVKLILYVRQTPVSLDIQVNDQTYHLVHAYPGITPEDMLWRRPSQYDPPKYPDKRVILGHTPVMYFHPSSSTYLTKAPGHMEIYHCDGFIGLDCGCGMPWNIPKRALSCLRLDDMAEFYENL